ncbi:MAG: PAS domain-containing sensor histidine kinase [Azospirillaceae bacterium]|nr:PAS domain-containing sensor histidine kinase [Azospirillaceae bacterium]
MKLGAATRICLGYALLGITWILTSDFVLDVFPPLFSGHPVGPWVGPAKGVAFVIVTALLLHRMLTRTFRADAEKAQALVVSEARYATLAEMSPVGIFQADGAGTVTFHNDKMRELAGVPTPMERGWVHAEDRDRVRACWEAAIATGGFFSEEFRMARPDGRLAWVLCQAAPIAAGPAGYVGVLIDLTDRQVALEEVRLGKERYELAVTGSAVGIVDWRLADDDLHLSDQARALLRLPLNERATGHALLRLLPADERRRVFSATRDHLDTRAPFDLELRLRCADGVTRWFHARGQVVQDAQGRPRRALGSLVDISVRKETESQLARARQDAEMASLSKTAFLASMSHELRTPLNAIIGFSELITQQTYGAVGDPRYAEYAEDIRVSGLHLLDLVNDILDVARMEAGRFELEDKVVDIAAEIAIAVRQIQAGNLQRHLEVTVAPGAGGLHAMVDPTALRQVLLNLLGNAAKFTPDGGRVTVAATIRADGLALSVTDTGPGISRHVLENLGQPFLQAEPSLRRRHGGSGLGLFIVRRLMELHGGMLMVDCPPGGGTCVTVVFPPDRQVPPGPALAMLP